jgi:hypothetical protein
MTVPDPNFDIKLEKHFKVYLPLKDKIIFEAKLKENNIRFHVDSNQSTLDSEIRYFFREQDWKKVDDIITAEKLAGDFTVLNKTYKLYLYIVIAIAIVFLFFTLIGF